MTDHHRPSSSRRALALLGEQSELTSSELAAALSVSRSHAGRLLRQLHVEGLVDVRLRGGGVLAYSLRRRPRNVSRAR